MRRGTTIGLLCSAVLIAGTPSAEANRMTVFACHGPSGEATGHDGWVNLRSAQGGMAALDSCGPAGQGTMSLELAGNSAGFPNAAAEEWQFQAPSWADIVRYRVELADSYALPYTGAGEGQVFVSASDEADPIYDFRNLALGSLGASTIERAPPAPDSWVLVNASCDGYLGPCPANTRIARADVSSAAIELADPTSPTVTSLTGGLLAPGPLRGTAAVALQASDEGPGVYSAWLTVDGTALTPTILDSNGGWCQSLGTGLDGTRSFAHPNPCPQHASGTLTLDTAGLADGEHTVSLEVDDASGNTTTALETTITTQNAPQETAAPSLTGASTLSPGATVTAQPGSWSVPAGAGALAVRYRWQRCDAAGSSCAEIPGAEGRSYALSAADSGYAIRAVVNASDNDGSTSAATAASSTVAPPPGFRGTPNGIGATDAAQLLLNGRHAVRRSFARSVIGLSGSLRDAAGEPIADATLEVVQQPADGGAETIGRVSTDAHGMFSVSLPAGPSRTITVGYRAFSLESAYASAASVVEQVAAGVSLHVTPRRLGSQGTITLAGRVLGRVPRGGVIVELLVYYRGRWEPFRTPRTDSRGRFRVHYEFQGARGRFPFRAAVPGGQAGFPYAEGVSLARQVQSG